MPLFADIIIDISHDQVDKTFQYIIPEELQSKVTLGASVLVPFGKGNKIIKGYVIAFSQTPSIDASRLKAIHSIDDKSTNVENQLIELAAWIKNNCGSTMIQALKTVMPVKKKIAKVEQKIISLKIPLEEIDSVIREFDKKKNVARVRLLTALKNDYSIDYHLATAKLNISPQTIKSLEKLGIIRLESNIIMRDPISYVLSNADKHPLNEEQSFVVNDILTDTSELDAYLIHGITGSGKTEIYISLIENVIKDGKQAIVLIPEISLTYQTVMRFYKHFGNRVSIINSKLSQGERFDQFERAKSGDIDIIIGPRSALFTPFPNLGIIIIDEEHEQSYKSENVPRYHAREVAIARSKICKAKVVLGSATPSVESYYKALNNEYKLYKLEKRASGGQLANVEIIDLREELKEGNKSIISRRLFELMNDRLEKNEQIMLFLNRRGFEGFVSCRSCGNPVKCPHCDVTLTEHRNNKLICHYCGYEEKFIKKCKKCGSPYVGGFKAGTEKIQMLVQQMFPNAKIVRMDADTTKSKDSHQKILSAFSNREADILIGTQMIVKGHDFSNVTLVGVLAADLSLYASDFRSQERTFQLLTQAAGRAGRGQLPGDVIIQTYSPDNYAIEASAIQDYNTFYEKEILYRSLMDYPPVSNMMLIIISSVFENRAEALSKELANIVNSEDNIKVIGPSKPSISKINDIYKRIIIIKSKDSNLLIAIKDKIDNYILANDSTRNASIIYDMNPLNLN